MGWCRHAPIGRKLKKRKSHTLKSHNAENDGKCRPNVLQFFQCFLSLNKCSKNFIRYYRLFSKLKGLFRYIFLPFTNPYEAEKKQLFTWVSWDLGSYWEAVWVKGAKLLPCQPRVSRSATAAEYLQALYYVLRTDWGFVDGVVEQTRFLSLFYILVSWDCNKACNK